MQAKTRNDEFNFSFCDAGAVTRISGTAADETSTVTTGDSVTLVLRQDVRKAVREVYDLVVTA